MTHQSSDQETPYHSLTKPYFQKDEWDHDYYELVDTVDANVKQAGTAANMPASTDVPDYAWYEATDEGLIYTNDPTDGWVTVGFGTLSNPVPAAYIDTLTLTSADTPTISFEEDGELTYDASSGVLNFTLPLEVNGNDVWHGSNFDPSNKVDTSNPSTSGTFEHSGDFQTSQFRSADVANSNSGQTIVSNGDGTFSMENSGTDPSVQVADAPNGNVQTVELEDTESTEISVAIPPGEAIRVYRWGCYNISNSTAPSGLKVQLLSDDDTVVFSENTVNSRDTTGDGVAWYQNDSSSLEVCKLSIKNTTGSTSQVGGFFGYIVS